MSEAKTVEAAIRAWEQARVTEEGARKAVYEAKAALALANRALDEAGAREDEARHEVARLMPPGVGEGRTYEQATGLMVDGRFYLKFSDEEIRSIRIADPPAGPAEEPDGNWTSCNVVCPCCAWSGGLVHYRPLQFDYRLRCDRCGHTWRSATFDEKGGQR